MKKKKVKIFLWVPVHILANFALPFAAVEDPQALPTCGFVTTTEMLLVLRLHSHSGIT